MSQFIDWDLAVGTAKTLMPAGPALSAKQAARIVEELRIAAGQGLREAEKVLEAQTSTAPSQTLVVDRGGWAKAVSQNFAAMLPELPHTPSALPLIAGAELGAVLSIPGHPGAWPKFDLFPAGPRLLLNAPTITQIRGELNLNARDFSPLDCHPRNRLTDCSLNMPRGFP